MTIDKKASRSGLYHPTTRKHARGAKRDELFKVGESFPVCRFNRRIEWIFVNSVDDEIIDTGRAIWREMERLLLFGGYRAGVVSKATVGINAFIKQSD